MSLQQTQQMTFDEWMLELRRIASEEYRYAELAVKSMHPDDWRALYQHGVSPEEAMASEMSAIGG